MRVGGTVGFFPTVFLLALKGGQACLMFFPSLESQGRRLIPLSYLLSIPSLVLLMTVGWWYQVKKPYSSIAGQFSLTEAY